MKLHLGCGQRYLEGYINIDFPPTGHSVQKTSIADLHADILDLRYRIEEIQEVRLHHVFEHFSRPVACALLASWYSWLAPNGKLHIEVPDVQKTARALVIPGFSFRKQAVAERHIFGSHEANWAVHFTGYTAKTLKKFLISFGFRVTKIKRNSWKGTYNFEIFAEKINTLIKKNDFELLTLNYLKNFLVDDSESETELLLVWMDTFKEHLEKTWGILRNE